MNTEDIRSALKKCDAALRKGWLQPKSVRYDSESVRPAPVDAVAHATWMISQTLQFLDEGKIDKAMRWLGFIQGVLWTTGRCTIEELKEMNR